MSAEREPAVHEMLLMLHRRAADSRARAQIRRWEYRQRHHSKGVWYRLRRLLASASQAFVVSDEIADALIQEGFLPERVGFELHPKKTLLVVPPDRVAQIASRRSIPVRLDATLLTARALVLVQFVSSELR